MTYCKYAVLALPRTGSTLLNEMLSRHPNIAAYWEVFNFSPDGKTSNWRNALEYWRQHLDHSQIRSWPELKQVDALQAADVLRTLVWHDGFTSNVKAVGFKLLADQICHPESCPGITAALRTFAPSMRVILLIRKNLLHAYTSYRIASHLNVWNAGRDCKTQGRPQVSLTAAEIERAFRASERQTELLFDLVQQAQAVYHLSYEELISQTTLHWHKVQRFLRLPEAPLPDTTLTKLETRPMRLAIANYDVLQEWFAGTRWGGFFDE